MSDTTATPTQDAPPAANGGAPAGAPTGADTAPPADLAAEVEKWKSLARKHEAGEKANADAAARLKAIEDANKSEIDKEREARTAAEEELKTLRGNQARIDAAVAAKLPLEFASRLVGMTPEELKADAEALKKSLGIKDNPPVSLGGGPRGDAPGAGPVTGDDWLRSAIDAKRRGL